MRIGTKGTQALRRQYDAACRDKTPDRFYNMMGDSFREGHMQPDEFSIRELFEQFVPGGREVLSLMDPRNQGNSINLIEATAVNTTAFSNISGQLIFSTVLDKYGDPSFLAPRLARTISTPFNGEKIPGIGRISDEASSIAEGNPYPLAGLSEEWIETPVTTKRGMIVPVTKEAVFFDRTGIILERAGEVAYWLGVNKEKRVIDVALGVTNNYNRLGTAENTFQDGTPSFDNTAGSNALADWTDIENAELLFDAMTDPNTGEPIMVTPTDIVVPTALLHTAKRVINATEINYGIHGATSAATVTRAANPLTNYGIISSPMVKARTSSDSTWFIGDFMKAFAYMENWGIQTQQAGANSELEFQNDIVNQFKVSERGVAAALEPRYAVKSTS